MRPKSPEDPIQINNDHSALYTLLVLDFDMKSVYRTKGKYVNEDGEMLRKLVPMMLSGEVPKEKNSYK